MSHAWREDEAHQGAWVESCTMHSRRWKSLLRIQDSLEADASASSSPACAA